MKIETYNVIQCAAMCNAWNEASGVCVGFVYPSECLKQDGKERSSIFPPVPRSPYPCSLLLKTSGGGRTKHGIDLKSNLICIKGKK